MSKNHLVLVVPGLLCCAKALPRCSAWGSPWSRRPASHWGLPSRGVQGLGPQASLSTALDFVAPRHVGSSQTRDQTCDPCIGKQILNHWTTREVQILVLVIIICSWLPSPLQTVSSWRAWAWFLSLTLHLWSLQRGLAHGTSVQFLLLNEFTYVSTSCVLTTCYCAQPDFLYFTCRSLQCFFFFFFRS